jgi:hypothetical protein
MFDPRSVNSSFSIFYSSFPTGRFYLASPCSYLMQWLAIFLFSRGEKSQWSPLTKIINFIKWNSLLNFVLLGWIIFFIIAYNVFKISFCHTWDSVSRSGRKTRPFPRYSLGCVYLTLCTLPHMSGTECMLGSTEFSLSITKIKSVLDGTIRDLLF